MFRSTLIAAGAVLLCGASLAQQTVDPASVFPITSPIKDAGVFNVNTKRWMPRSKMTQQNGTIQVIYDNRCTWTGGGYYTGVGVCESYFDEGEIPGPGNLAFINAGGTGATNTNNVVLFQFGYCTNFALPNIKIGFYDSLGGNCVGFTSPTGPSTPTLAQQACPAGISPSGINPQGTAYYDLNSIGLPGDATPGGAAVSCWIFGAFVGNSGFCIKSEGEGVWDNNPDADRFNWSFEMDNVQVAGQAQSGVLIRGEPATPPNPHIFGACTYNLACDTDVITGAPCGTGLGAIDAYWINVDGDSAGSTNNTGSTCVAMEPGATGCYWFGGYPGNPFGSYWMALVANGSCDGVVPVVSNCQILATSTQGCQSSVSSVGLPSATSASPFNVTIAGLNVNVNGVVFYGIAGPVSVAWSPQSNLCVKSPTQRLGGFPGASGSTGGTAGNCNGSYTFNFNAIIQSTGLLGTPMAAGQRVDLQGWQRDPASSKTTNLTDALTFFVGS